MLTLLLSDIFSNIVTLDSFSLNLGDATGTLNVIHYPKVLNAVNLGLIEMYKEFPIKERSLTIQQYAHITEYTLSSEYAQTNTSSLQPYKYIADTPYNPFQDDVLKVEKIFNEIGEEHYINDEKEPTSLYTPSYNTIQHPYPNSNNAMFVHYRAAPVKILSTVIPATYEVDLPIQLLDIFLVWVAYRLLTGVDKPAASAKLGEYMLLKQATKNLVTFRTEESGNQKIENNGWV
jgi:hypothetical protein